MKQDHKQFGYDLRGFKEVVKQLQKISGKSFQDVMKAEAGMVLSSAMRTTPKASVKNIVRHNMPEGYQVKETRSKQTGEKLVTHRFGKVYHAGKPIFKGYQDGVRVQLGSGDLAAKRNKPSGAGKNWKPKRGGKIYEKPYPNQAWMGRAKWNEFVEESRIKTIAKVANRGMSAAQFGFMADMLGIKIVEKRNRPKYLKTAHLREKLTPFLMPRFESVQTVIVLESKGLKQTARTGAGAKLAKAAKGRVNLYKRAVKKDWIQDIKTFMPKNYPLMFGN